MSDKGPIYVLAIAFLLGLVSAGAFYQKVKPNEEQRLQMSIDQTIQDELCDRINKDIAKFKDSPHAFQRSSLQILFSESRESARALLTNLPDDFPIQYKGRAEEVTARCQMQARQWVKIPTVFPEYYEAEKTLVGLGNADSTALPLPSMQRPVSSQKRNRLALVIGNSAYKSRPLKNPLNDAQDMSHLLKDAGFDVIERYDADLDSTRSAVNEFTKTLSKYEVGLVYYSGHGIEFGGRNYFVPVNASIQTEDEIPRQAYDITVLVDKSIKWNKTTIFIVDACRNSPVFTSKRSASVGLSKMDAASGSIIAYAAAPGQIAGDGNGRNSPYTAALLKQIQIPNKKIEDVLKETRKAVSESTDGRQVPWYNSSLTGDFYFFEK